MRLGWRQTFKLPLDITLYSIIINIWTIRQDN